MITVFTRQRFAGGQVVMTRAVAALAERMPAGMLEIALGSLLARHFAGDFGTLSAGDVATQNAALEAEARNPEEAERMMSVYSLEGETIWIITEWDRSVTTVLFPSDY
jgi:hypothetical protein